MASTEKRFPESRSVAVVGAGPVGCLAALALANRGWEVDLFEAREDPRLSSTPRAAQRSINLALSARGIEGLHWASLTSMGPALAVEGLVSKVLQSALPMKGRMIHAKDSRGDMQLESQPYGLNGECINSVSRNDLNSLLLDEAGAHPYIRTLFGHRLRKVDFDAPEGAELEFEVRSAEGASTPYASTYRADLVLGTDGAHSAVRQQIQRRVRMDFSQEYIPTAYIELHIPPAKDEQGRDAFAMSPEHLHIWPKGDFMLIALPNQDKSFTSTLFMSFEFFESIKSKDQLLDFFKTHFPDSLPLLGEEELVRDFFSRRPSGLMTISCHPYHYSSRALLLGDASHNMVPFYGQGMNCGFEDVRVMLECFDRFAVSGAASASVVSLSTSSPSLIFNDDATHMSASITVPDPDPELTAALEHYTSTRHADLRAISSLALDNFHEMSSSVVSPLFLLRKRLDAALYRLVPSSWMAGLGWLPLYTMVTFRPEIGYAAARRKEEWQTSVLKGALQGFVGALGFAAAVGVGVAWRRGLIERLARKMVG